jgi:hypothetical protein
MKSIRLKKTDDGLNEYEHDKEENWSHLDENLTTDGGASGAKETIYLPKGAKKPWWQFWK